MALPKQGLSKDAIFSQITELQHDDVDWKSGRAFSLAIRDADPFAVGKVLRQRGWFVDEQKPPPSLHCTVNAVHQGRIGTFLRVLEDAIAVVRNSGATDKPKAYGATE